MKKDNKIKIIILILYLLIIITLINFLKTQKHYFNLENYLLILKKLVKQKIKTKKL